MSSTELHPGTASFSVNPATGERFARHDPLSDADLERVLARTAQAAGRWKDSSHVERQSLLRRFGAALRTARDGLAEEATREMGKPIAQARAEVEKCAALCDWYADHLPRLLADEPLDAGERTAWLAYRPLGVIFAVMPWNFPHWQILRAAMPIIAGGNGFLVKPAINTIGSARMLERLWQETDGPPDVFAVAHVTNEQASTIIADRRIAGVTVTGSVAAGSAIAAQAGRAVKKTVLELGGADPFIVLADADLDEVVPAAVTARFQNSGQICIAAKRLILEAPIAAAFTRRFKDAVAALKIGDPMEEETFIGPMAREDLLRSLDDQVRRSIAAGARLLTGGKRLDGPGAFYAPTILADVRPGMAAFDEELFGPVASLVVAADRDDAVTLANRSEYGLNASIWTSDPEAGRRLAARIEAGGVFINAIPASDPRLPIGGIKRSGYGRELGAHGIRAFMNAQTVCDAG
ncbi:NAD-dependent succinate-semialdehyde dehydrogenase [Acidomonas methanolica]|uniref:NAD-dependent succinate-semialdehyde dehydrogenase n=1 Tax=Acidomonas methanolica TaxID=437 RepID=UPI00211A0308|nr:NAD-dependent succinate-semialdehyde dehydrogenase [Acidomonas methanolica]MCQ9156175.1 NAD-dependent succinate-semialdehyde dehydrogenase [Acidomonas methanolica]